MFIDAQVRLSAAITVESFFQIKANFILKNEFTGDTID